MTYLIVLLPILALQTFFPGGELLDPVLNRGVLPKIQNVYLCSYQISEMNTHCYRKILKMYTMYKMYTQVYAKTLKMDTQARIQIVFFQ